MFSYDLCFKCFALRNGGINKVQLPNFEAIKVDAFMISFCAFMYNLILSFISKNQNFKQAIVLKCCAV